MIEKTNSVQQSRAAAEALLANVIVPKWAERRKVIRTIAHGSPLSEIIRYVTRYRDCPSACRYLELFEGSTRRYD